MTGGKVRGGKQAPQGGQLAREQVLEGAGASVGQAVGEGQAVEGSGYLTPLPPGPLPLLALL